MSRFTCDAPDCDFEYTVGEGEPTDSMFVSYAVTPHAVDDVEKRAFSLCPDCARELDTKLPSGEEADA